MTLPRPPQTPLRPLDEALAELLGHAQALADHEEVSTFDADGRVLAQERTTPMRRFARDYPARKGVLPSAGSCHVK